MQAVAKLEICT